MKKRLKHFLINLISMVASSIADTRTGQLVFDIIRRSMQDKVKVLKYRDVSLTFCIPNVVTRVRVDSFSFKEPETLDWIDSIPRGSILWDIGANIGLYSCYAAKSRSVQVYAFEPSVFNLEALARNIYINDLVSKIVIVPLPLTSALKFSTLNMSSTDWGKAGSTFGEEYGDDGKVIDKVFMFATVGISMDEAARVLSIPKPTHIKMDVDGLEHLILSGGQDVLHGVVNFPSLATR